MNNMPVWDSKIIDKYDLAGPRYTSYPTAVQFSEQFDRQNYISSAWQSSATNRPLSLYFHIPILFARLLLLRLQQNCNRRPQPL